jgi:hypothetical protein
MAAQNETRPLGAAGLADTFASTANNSENSRIEHRPQAKSYDRPSKPGDRADV